MSECCSRCGHGFEDRCSRCLRSFSCGTLAARCPECGDGILADIADAGYAVWLGEYYRDFPAKRKEARNLAEPNPRPTYKLKSEALALGEETTR